MTTLVDGLKPFIAAVGADYKSLNTRAGDLPSLQTAAKNNLVAAINECFGRDGDLATLATAAKGNLVAAINEVRAVAISAAGGGVSINDSATNGDTTVVWSADKVFDELAALKNSLVSGASAALDTFAELAAAMGNDPTFATTIATGLGNRVRFDAAQALTAAQKTQACANVGVGEPDTDFVALYVAAKA